MSRVIDCICGQQVFAPNDQQLFLACREHIAGSHRAMRLSDGEVRTLILENAYTVGAPIDPGAIALARRVFHEVWEKADAAAAESCFSHDYVNHDPALPEVPPGYRGVLENVTSYRTAFPDQRFSLHEIVAAGDKVVVRFSVTGTHTGRLGEILPTQRTVTVTGLTLFRVENGRICESWGHWDTLGLLQQVGAVQTVRAPAGA